MKADRFTGITGMRFKRDSTKNNRGVATIEFTIVALLLFTVLFGIAEIGWMFSRYLLVSNISRQACRQYALGDSISNVTNAVTDTAEQLGLLPNGEGFSLVSDIEYRTRSGNAWGPWVDATDAPQPGDQVRVTITYSYPALVGAFVLKSRTATVSAATVMRREESYVSAP